MTTGTRDGTGTTDDTGTTGAAVTTAPAGASTGGAPAGPARMRNAVRPYAWGSRTVIARLQGRDVADGPEAELWMGAHPGDPSHLEGDGEPPRSLAEVIEGDPAGVLGPAVHDRFGARLPFLLKVLAAEAPLSLQVHPSDAQAAQGWEAQARAGVGPHDPDRTFCDPWAKPELLVALEPFTTLCGFRTADGARALLAGLGLPAVDPLLQALDADPGPEGLRTAFARLIGQPSEEGSRFAAEVASAASRVAARDPAYGWVVRLAEHHEGDPGVAAPLLLDLVRLAPGEGLYLPAGNVHAYLEGCGVEVMGASDNVLRAGLTAKRVDVEAVLSVLRVCDGDTSVQRPVGVGPEQVWDVGVPEFRLSRLDVGPAPVALDRRGPEVLLCVDGSVEVSCAGTPSPVRLGSGESAFVPASAGPVRLQGTGAVFRATPGLGPLPG